VARRRARQRRLPPAHPLGLVALLAADTVYGLSLLGGGWDAGGPVDATWIVFYLGFGLAALHPSMVCCPSRPRRAPA